MIRQHTLRTILFCGGLVAAAASSACGGGEESQPIAETQSHTAAPANQPVNVEGCLRAGESDGTFVLTTARSTGSEQTATYQLVGASNVRLADHVGNRVQIRGTVRAQQEIASQTTAVPAERPADQPQGQTATPKVITQTEIDIKRVTVDTVTSSGEKCDI